MKQESHMEQQLVTNQEKNRWFCAFWASIVETNVFQRKVLNTNMRFL